MSETSNPLIRFWQRLWYVVVVVLVVVVVVVVVVEKIPRVM